MIITVIIIINMHNETDHYAMMRHVSSALVGNSSAKDFAVLQAPVHQRLAEPNMHGLNVRVWSVCWPHLEKYPDCADSMPEQVTCCTAGSQLDET